MIDISTPPELVAEKHTERIRLVAVGLAAVLAVALSFALGRASGSDSHGATVVRPAVVAPAQAPAANVLDSCRLGVPC